MARQAIDLSTLGASDKYVIFRCKSNPFPITGVSASDLGFPPTDEKVTEEILAFIKSTYDRKSYGGLVIVGDYGFGKTYILRHVERQINEALYYRGSERACAVYIDNPEPPAIEDFITKFLDRFGMHKFLTLLWHLVSQRFQEGLIKEGPGFLNRFFKSPSQLELFGKKSVNAADAEAVFGNPFKFIDWLYESSADLGEVGRFAQKEVFESIFNHPEITERLSSLDNYSEGESYRRWMEILNYKTIRRTLRKELDPSVFFRSILTVFRQNGFRHVYLLVDEFEDVYSRTDKRGRLAYCSALRGMIEYNMEYFSLILAVKLDAWDKITAEMAAFAERFARKVELLGLTKQQLERLIVDYLSRVRDEDSGDKDSVYPFDADAVDEILHVAHANHRVALEICYVLFEYAADQGLTTISAALVRDLPKIRESLVKARAGRIEL